MATLYKVGTTYRILFGDGNGNRKSIWLGKMPKKAAETVLSRVEEMLACRLVNRSYPPEVSSWLAGLSDGMVKKLANAGLTTYERHTTSELWTAFRKQKKGVKKTTLNVYNYAEQRFFSFFDRNTDLRRLTGENFKDWMTFLQTEYRSPRTDKPLDSATVAGTVTKAKAVFNWAVSEEWIASSPLKGVGRGSFVNSEKDREVTMGDYYLILGACPCLDWRVITALARIGGLHPCEIMRLRWSDIDWERNRFTTTNTKTEQYKDKGIRVVPLFHELRVELLRLFQDESSQGKEYVVNCYTNRENQSLAVPFDRITKRAGLAKIPRPFDNMRASRSTEVYDEFGAFLESKWIGHSTKTALKHYLQVREVDFERAVSGGQNGQPMVQQEFELAHSSAPNGKPKNRVAQIPAQQASESAGTELQEHEKKPTFVGSVDSLPDGATAQNAEERTRTSTPCNRN